MVNLDSWFALINESEDKPTLSGENKTHKGYNNQMAISNLEAKIKAAHGVLISVDSTSAERKKAAADMSRLNKLRDPRQVRAMEVERGLRS